MLGSNLFKQLGNDKSGNQHRPDAVSLDEDVVSLAVGSHQSCAITASGEAHCWGANSQGQRGDDTTAASLVPTIVFGTER